MGKKKIYLLWGIMVLIIMIAGSYAYFSWITSEARLVLTVGDINNIQVVLKPYKIDTELLPVLTYDNEEYVNVDAINKSNNSKKFELYYHINEIDEELKNNNFKYTITKSTDGGNTYTEVKTDSFKEADNNIDFIIYSEKVPSKTTIKYKVYVWLDGSKDGQTNVIGKSFNAELRAQFDNSNIVVDIPEGMIPIVFDTSSGTVVKTISSDDSSWYDYDKQLWANAILVTSSSRSNYLGTTGVTVNESDILAYYTYIPRYKYKIWSVDNDDKNGKEQSIDIQFENTDIKKSTGSNVSEYITHPAFTFGDTELNGIWVGKFETTGTEEEPTVLPDVSSLRNQNVSTQFKTALKFSGGNLLSNGNVSFSGNNTYGLTVKANAHMMKNSEWGAVAYLSHSIYGTNREVYINNSSGYYTGRSGGNVGGSTPINGTYLDQTSTETYNTSGFYTWDGYLLEYDTNTKSTTRDLTKVASTTGNITGVYDMSGGVAEYIMGIFANSSGELWSGYTTEFNSGFTGLLGSSGESYTGVPFPDSKYYDVYKAESSTTINILTACNGGVCYGHSLSETSKWYNDGAGVVYYNYPWYWRGGSYVDGSLAGALHVSGNNGYAGTLFTFRTTIINDPNGKTITSPTITIGTNGNSGYVSGNISSTITVDKGSADLDQSTLKYIYSTSNSTVPTTSFTSGNSYTLEGATGTYYLIAKACDADGLCTTEVSNPFYVDNTAPTGTISLTKNSLTINVVSSFSDISGISKYYYKIQTNNSCGTTGYVESNNNNYAFSVNTAATYYVCVMAKDNAGNISNPVMSSIDISSTVNIKVDIPEGMIPIVFDTSSGTLVKTISSDNSSWYDYDNQEWANAILVTSSSRSNYLGTTGVTVNESDILAYYTYIPRYKYKIWTTGLSSTGQEQSIDIQFENTDIKKSTGSNVSEYITHSAFTFGDTELNGIWVGKFETTGTEEEPTVLPDISSLRNQNVSTQFKTSLKFSGGNLLSNGNVSFSGNNTYGLTVKANAHMMKNSEWGAVAYLSHSIYGVNREVYINNSSGYYTGRSGGNVGGSTPINGTYPAQTSTAQSNTYGFYTWDGYLLEYDTNTKSTTRDLTKVASTTGNITGIYDMSGGATEYVMKSYEETISYSGFSTMPNSKYYDNYVPTSILTACNGKICYGHALSETANWYDDAMYLADSNRPWFSRGGFYGDGSTAGEFHFYDNLGGAGDAYSFRSVVINDPNGKTITSPTITIGTNGNSGYVNGNISSTITVDKGSADLDQSTLKYIYSTNNSATPTTNFTSGNSYTLDGATGTYYLIAKACDVDGLCTTKVSNPFYVDNTAPTGTVSVSINNKVILGTVNATDNGSGVSSYMYALSTSASCPSSGYTESTNNSYSVSISSAGTYYVCVKIKDKVGNISNTISGTIKYVSETTYINSGKYTYTVPITGVYKLEAWGAQGGGSAGGYGGYTSGNIYLVKGTTINIYVGGTSTTIDGGYNGGGAGYSTNVAGGGGATDYRYGGTSLYNRIMVAGGGGGNNYYRRGHAGGLIGTTAYDSDDPSYTSGGGTQTSGGKVNNYSAPYPNGTDGSFGQGGTGGGAKTGTGTYGGSFGGGGGYYGGGGGSRLYNGSYPGGGGSSYISGHTGSVAVSSSSSTTPRTGKNGASCTTGTSDNLCSIHYSGKTFSNTVMIDGGGYAWTNSKGGLKQMPNPSGGSYASGVGKTGSGAARVTFISASAS